MKQDSLASQLGISQQAVSKIEQSPEVEEEVLNKIAAAPGVSTEGLRNFTEDAIFNNTHNFHDQSIRNNFNPIEKVSELYERLLQREKEKSDLLKEQLKR